MSAERESVLTGTALFRQPAEASDGAMAAAL
jgi:hypothetical protein